MTMQDKTAESANRLAQLVHESFRCLPPLLDDASSTDHVLQERLRSGANRVGALWTLLFLPESVRRRYLRELLGLATFAHSDLGLARMVLLSLDRVWLAEKLRTPLDDLLSSPSATEDEFRRAAELAQQVGAGLLARVTERARVHKNEEIQEVASDFAPTTFSETV